MPLYYCTECDSIWREDEIEWEAFFKTYCPICRRLELLPKGWDAQKVTTKGESQKEREQKLEHAAR